MKKLLTGVSAAVMMMASASYAETTLKLVEVITSPERTEVLQGMVTQFEADNPDVTVEIVSLPWGQAFEKLATMVAGGDIPDVVEMPDVWQALYAGAGQLASLTNHVAGWEHGATLTDKTIAMGSQAGDLYMIPYGFYLRAMFYNKKLLAEAGIENPPTTMEEFMAASAAVSELDGKYGYCLRGGPGGTNGWIMFAATMNGSNEFFTEDGVSRINEPGSVEGIQFMIDMYQNGNAPRDSVNWGFNEIVAGFYSGTCAFLDQDPDALIAISERMPADDFAVIPMPVGPSGKAFPTIGFAGWSIFNSTEHEDEAFDLVAALSSPEANSVWAQRVGVIPIHKGADQDPFFQTEQFKGWFDTLNGEQYEPTTMPTYLEQWGYFASSVLLETSQEALLGQRTAQDVADEWAELLTDEYANWQANQ
ncbi:ABC transporter substrate-binding protein [Pacificibacter marinus]|uniref:sn-glycerol-3-phosphate-binding periplasmic protein UgpB n=1 Tax=Pacificibacter marinus TaxID=658057 RepID=A0A1Y5RV31_9RHOB|nr:sugar ABC transporter substrate-binding protein [Pacificibacter marinus]SEK44122.1 carbohydrate ABC transporter substrate-binding protein, CUT1 family [Pacificibacter marinus]SLN23272.1 sn-glycerol-3-phosphate-binding periplasmic protein UgpB precursor [Pacificibacter marinus]